MVYFYENLLIMQLFYNICLLNRVLNRVEIFKIVTNEYLGSIISIIVITNTRKNINELI